MPGSSVTPARERSGIVTRDPRRDVGVTVPGRGCCQEEVGEGVGAELIHRARFDPAGFVGFLSAGSAHIVVDGGCCRALLFGAVRVGPLNRVAIADVAGDLGETVVDCVSEGRGEICD